jgi:nickel-type superoxide dismutase maturation protease
MQPALRPGDRLLVGQWLRVRAGDIVLVRDPQDRSSFGVKRVSSVQANGDVVVLGDNPNVSRDSRHFGPVARRSIVGKVIYRYLPAERRGTLP